jgi:hypothetical protein
VNPSVSRLLATGQCIRAYAVGNVVHIALVPQRVIGSVRSPAPPSHTSDTTGASSASMLG